MMALFIVLWLMNSSKPIQVAISGYFKDPSGTGKQTGSTLDGTGEKVQPAKQDMAKMKEELQKSIQDINDLAKLKNNIEITVTSEGLRIELLESENGTFFDSGSSTLNKSGQQIATLAGGGIGKSSQPSFDRGTHRRQTIYRQAQLQQLGTLGGSGECGAAPDAAVGIARRSGLAGAGLRGPAPAQRKRSAGPVEPAHFNHRAVPRQ